MPSPESLPPRERLEAQFNLSAQWKEQTSALNESGVLEILPESRSGEPEDKIYDDLSPIAVNKEELMNLFFTKI